MPAPADLLDALATGSRTRAELQARLGVSQPTVSRLVRAAGDRVVPIGRGPATRYAATRKLPGLGDRLPLYRIDPQGRVQVVGRLLALAGGEFWCDFEGRAGELHPGLPYFLQDMRPQGFMGRGFAQRFAAALGLPARLGDWNDDAHLAAMALYGEDLAGNLIVGDMSLERFYNGSLQAAAVPAATRAAAYPRLAEAILESQPGSSAGGEQPKFTAVIADDVDAHRHVIVKFSPPGDEAAARRWRDLLRAEHQALQLLQRHGLAAAVSELLEAEGRLFLEVERFDRIGRHGRRGLLSLSAIDAHHFGQLGSWSDCALRLERQRLLGAAEARRIRLLDTFGALIANTDRHFGNLSLFVDDAAHALAPVYDMLPMAYRPTDNGELRPQAFQPALPTAQNRDVWSEALAMARQYWDTLAGTPGLSAEFREIVAGNQAVLERLGTLQPPA